MSQAINTTEKKSRYEHLQNFIQKRRPAEIYTLIFIFFALVVSGIYFQTLEAPFAFDDIPRIEANRHIRLSDLSPKDIFKAGFKSSKTRPVAYITFALNYYFGQYDPTGYHIVNILVHIFSGFFLFLFIRITFKTPALEEQYPHPDLIAFLAALIWLAHPVQTQSVTYIVQRMNSMASMLFVLSFWSYVKGRLAQGNRKKWLWYMGSTLIWLVSLGCKQITVTLPLLVFIYEWYFFQDLSRDWLKRSLKWVLGITVLIGIVALIYTDFNPFDKLSRFHDFKRNEFTLAQRALTQLRVVIYYISLLGFPHPSRLNLDYDFPLSYSLIDPFTTSLSLIIILSLVLLSVYLAKRQRLISFCILWFFGNLVIESSVIPLALIFEHRLYLPSMLVSLLFVVISHQYIKPRWLSVGVTCSLILLLSYWAFERNKVWQDNISLWADAVKKSPSKARPYSNLGSVLTKKQQYDEALPNLLRALQLDPDYAPIHYNLGFLTEKQGKIEEAIKHYRKAVQLKPNFFKAHNNLGAILAKQENIIAAEEHYLKALQIKPDFAEAHNNLGLLLAKQEKLDEAIEHYHLALQINPDYAEAHFNLGLVLEKQGKKDEAEEHYLKSQQSNPNLAELQNKLGLLLAKQGRIDEANEHYRKALQINPDYAAAYFNLGDALIEQGRTEQGMHHLKRALEIDPDYSEAHNNLGGQLLQEGKIDEALGHFNAALKTNPDISEAHSNIGIIMIHKGNINEAIFHFQEAVRINPEFKLAQDNLQRALAIQRNQMDTEMEKIRAALKNNPDDPQLNYELGNLYLGKGELNEAIHQFQRALSFQPNFPEALNNLAMAHTFGRQYDQALEEFQKLIALQPDNAATYYNVAVLYALKNIEYESLVWLNKAVARGYDNWDLIKTDKDLENIRNSEGFRELVKGR